MLNNLIARLAPFAMIGVCIVMMVLAFLVMSSILVWGLVIGGVLFIISIVRRYFVQSLRSKKSHKQTRQSGRTIDYDDLSRD